ncbi:dimethylmenaquinone methyltransferase [Mycolicibacterium goodii]|uniref:Putative 4-hydroxy-4-methyl-2-oxoglutarate aldolase n=1 Tax=Mycolicibacterium goodii TaxID=134601 RepID=A0A0K0X0F3_MYCGD|nr:dimethylmenaquinone methyltransferase [Mycolicibacterium goodii]
MTDLAIDADTIAELRRAGVATVYEARGRQGLIDADFIQLIPGSRAAGPARTVRCAQNDNRGVHELVAHLQPGEIAVLTMPEPAPVALIGDLLVTQIRQRGAAGILVDASVRDAEELRKMGLPIWTRWIRVRGATKDTRGEVDASVEIGGATIRTGDIVILDSDGAAVVPAAEAARTVELARAREDKEAASRAKYLEGHISYDLYGYRAEDEGNT